MYDDAALRTPGIRDRIFRMQGTCPAEFRIDVFKKSERCMEILDGLGEP
jgi:hypothetical protein